MRKVLTQLTSLLALIAVICFAFVLWKYMNISARELGERASIDISKLHEGEYQITDFPRNNAWNLKVLLIKDWGGTLYTYLLPSNDGKITMPDALLAWYGYYHCSDFSPEIGENNKIKKNGHVICHDPNAMAYNRSEWVWAYSGRPLGVAPHMPVPKTEIIGHELYFNYK